MASQQRAQKLSDWLLDEENKHNETQAGVKFDREKAVERFDSEFAPIEIPEPMPPQTDNDWELSDEQVEKLLAPGAQP